MESTDDAIHSNSTEETPLTETDPCSSKATAYFSVLREGERHDHLLSFKTNRSHIGFKIQVLDHRGIVSFQQIHPEEKVKVIKIFPHQSERYVLVCFDTLLPQNSPHSRQQTVRSFYVFDKADQFAFRKVCGLPKIWNEQVRHNDHWIVVLSTQEDIDSIFWIDMKSGVIFRPSVGRNGKLPVLALMGNTRESTMAYSLEKSSDRYHILCMTPSDDPTIPTRFHEVSLIDMMRKDIAFMDVSQERLVLIFQEKLVHRERSVKSNFSDLSILIYERPRNDSLELVLRRDMENYPAPMSPILETNGILAITTHDKVEWIDTTITDRMDHRFDAMDGSFVIPFIRAVVELNKTERGVEMLYWRFERKCIRFMAEGINYRYSADEVWEVTQKENGKLVFPRMTGDKMRYFACIFGDNEERLHWADYSELFEEQKNPVAEGVDTRGPIFTSEMSV